MAFSVAFTFDAIFSVRLTRKSRAILSPSLAPFLVLFAPCTAHSRWRLLALLEPVALGGELVVALGLLAPGQLAGGHEVRPAAGVLDGVVVRQRGSRGCG